jgi:carbon monoxide dehydrogenase subunit G
MTDAQEVAPCVPGAQITDVVDETHYKGTVKIKLGAVQMTYRGELEMRADQDLHTIVLQARGTETRGSGGASGTFTTTLTQPEDGVTQVEIKSRVDVTGRVAQFGRGIMQDVANRMIKDFASCLEAKLAARSQQGNVESPSVSEPPRPEQQAASQVAPSAPASENVAHVVRAGASSNTPPPTPPPPTRMPSAPTPSTELRLADLLADIARARLAAGLRALAKLVEPK